MAKKVIAQAIADQTGGMTWLSQLLGFGDVPLWAVLLKAALSAAGMVGAVMAALYVSVGALTTGQANQAKFTNALAHRVDRLEQSVSEIGSKIDEIKFNTRTLVDSAKVSPAPRRPVARPKSESKFPNPF